MSFSANYPTIAPSLLLDFANSNAVDPRVTFTRASTATYFNSIGTLTTAAVNTPRLDYNPSTLAAQGLLIEEQRTNSIRNNTGVGAVAGTPGTLPTNWTLGGTTTGLTISVIGTGTENGITYVDIRFNGTAGAALNPNIIFDTPTAIAAANGQSWSWSTYVSLSSGSLTNVTDIIAVQGMFNSTSTFLGTLASSSFVPTNAGLRTQRQTFLTTLNQATTAFVRPQLQFSVANGAAIDITLRIGLPQLEQGAFATSVIPTSTGAVTRSADVASVNTLSPWFNATEGTIYAEFNVPSALITLSSPRVFSLFGSGGAAVDEILLFVAQVSGKAASFNVFTGAVNAGRIDATPSFVANTVIKAAACYATNDRAVTANGVAPITSTTAYTIPTITLARLGAQDAGVNSVLNGYLRRVTYYPRRLTNANLQAITS